jgi:hypothetical protein
MVAQNTAIDIVVADSIQMRRLDTEIFDGEWNTSSPRERATCTPQAAQNLEVVEPQSDAVEVAPESRLESNFGLS